VQTELEVEKALGRYHGPWFAFISTLSIGIGWIYIELQRIGYVNQRQDAVLVICWVLALVAFWCIPKTVITRSGIRLVWRLRFIPWTDVERIYQAGPGDPNILVGLKVTKGVKLTSLPGVHQNRLPGIVILARRASSRAAPDDFYTLLPRG